VKCTGAPGRCTEAILRVLVLFVWLVGWYGERDGRVLASQVMGNDESIEQILNSRQVTPAASGGDIGDIRDSFMVGLAGMKLPVEHIFIMGTSLPWAGSGRPSVCEPPNECSAYSSAARRSCGSDKLLFASAATRQFADTHTSDESGHRLPAPNSSAPRLDPVAPIVSSRHNRQLAKYQRICTSPSLRSSLFGGR